MKLSARGEKAFKRAIYDQKHGRVFNARQYFPVIKETAKALMLQCLVTFISGQKVRRNFWIPKAMAADYGFVLAKTLEVKAEFPPASGATVEWERIGESGE